MDREHAHHLLDQLAPAQLAAVVHLMEIMVTPEEDRDTLSNAESRAIAEADEWLKHHPPIPHEEILRVLRASKASTQRTRRISVTSVLSFHRATENTETLLAREEMLAAQQRPRT